MTKAPLYHEIPHGGRSTVPAWWFGAPFIALAYAFVTPRFLPDIVDVPENLSHVAEVVRVLVGLVLGVGVLSAWRIARWARSRRRQNQD